MALYSSRCEQCGQTDDHPKVVTFDGHTFHHDCLSADLKAQIVESNEIAKAVIEACEGGLKGAELRERISALHEGA